MSEFSFALLFAEYRDFKNENWLKQIFVQNADLLAYRWAFQATPGSKAGLTICLPAKSYHSGEGTDSGVCQEKSFNVSKCN